MARCHALRVAAASTVDVEARIERISIAVAGSAASAISNAAAVASGLAVRLLPFSLASASSSPLL
jgi:hypothetical protein